MEWENVMKSAFESIASNADLSEFAGPASDDDIRSAEKILNVQFPDAYRCFLETKGCGNFSDAEFYGIVPGMVPGKGIPCAVWFTLDERRNSSLPDDFVVIYSSGLGPLYCLSTSEIIDGDCPVREWTYGKFDKTDDDIVSRSFSSFIHEKIQERA